MSFHNSAKKYFFQNTKISAQLIDFKNLDASLVIFLACSLIDLTGLCSLTGLNSLYSPSSSNIFLVLMV